MKKDFYLSTAIAYTSSTPHIGNVYEAILADAICRFKRKQGYNVYFQTGTDEHGQKIENKAKEAKINPKEYVDKIANDIKNIYDMMNVSYDKFIRTTDKNHEIEVQKVFDKLLKQGDIYKGEYEGWYCEACESFFTEKDLNNSCCPDCNSKVNLAKEEAYFFKLSKYQDKLINHIKSHPEFIEPESRKNEMLNNFLKDKLPDLCVSRTSYKWGIPVLTDEKHVIYVWIDALMNYLTGIGFDVLDNQKPKFWPCDIHLIGKDILRFHTIYWPILLMALNIELPKKVFGHPWILMNHGKMSKSKGNVIYTKDLVDIFGVDAVRYYVLHEIPYKEDGNITYELVCERANSDLANLYGNLVNRSIAMTNKYFNGQLKYIKNANDLSNQLENLAKQTVQKYIYDMDRLHVSDAIESVMNLARKANKYIDETMPWLLAKDETKKDLLQEVLYNLLEVIRISSILLENIMPDTSKKVLDLLNIKNNSYKDLEYAIIKQYKLNKEEIIFKRLDLEKDVLSKLETKEEKNLDKQNLINIDEFFKSELVVGKILSCEKHKEADKLLVLQVDLGNNDIRQIVSGIAKYYTTDMLVNKKVVVVKNLEPVKLRGVLSSGMILCASNKDKLEVIEVKNLNPGDKVS